MLSDGFLFLRFGATQLGEADGEMISMWTGSSVSVYILSPCAADPKNAKEIQDCVLFFLQISLIYRGRYVILYLISYKG